MTTDTTAPAADTTAAPAGFEDLQAEAVSIEGGPAAPGTPTAAAQEAASIEQTTRELLQALQMARMLVSPMFRWWGEFGQVWNDQTLQGISLNGALIMQRHGWDFGELMTRWGPYIGLAVVTVPPCAVTYQAIKLRAAELQRQAKQPKPEAPNDGHGQATH